MWYEVITCIWRIASDVVGNTQCVVHIVYITWRSLYGIQLAHVSPTVCAAPSGQERAEKEKAPCKGTAGKTPGSKSPAGARAPGTRQPER